MCRQQIFSKWNRTASEPSVSGKPRSRAKTLQRNRIVFADHICRSTEDQLARSSDQLQLALYQNIITNSNTPVAHGCAAEGAKCCRLLHVSNMSLLVLSSTQSKEDNSDAVLPFCLMRLSRTRSDGLTLLTDKTWVHPKISELQISSDMRQAKKTMSALVQREAPARRATAFCLFPA